MKFIKFTKLFSLLGAGCILITSVRAQESLNIVRPTDSLGFAPPIPVAISGFSGEVASVLKDDLRFMGFIHVGPDQAKYLISGNNDSRVEGRVVEKINKNQLLAKAYTGNSLRAQAHAFADDIALALTGKPGIAQKKIAFKAETGGWNSEIYIADYDGHNPQAVTQDRATAVAPCWLGASALYYASYKLGGAKIFYHNLPTGERRLVTPFSGSNISPAASPDGKRLAMVLSKSGNPELFVSDLNGANLKQLTFTKEAESSPCWSPDSQTICYVSRERGTPGLYTISASGGAARRISTSGASSPTEPDWSPDGKWIAFTTLRGNFEICIVKAQGGEAITIAPGEDPTWAPNSRAIIFCKGPDKAKKLSLLDVPSKQVKDIARILGSQSNSQPSWTK